MRWPFRRKKDVSTVPSEIQEYYQTEKRERTGVAWLLALGTLLITIGLAAILFFGGRWAYRAIVDNDDNNQETAQNETEQNPQESGTQENAPAENSNPSSGTSSTSTSTPNNTQTSTQGAQSTPSTTTTNTSGTTQVSTSTPVTGDSSLPNTGPGDTLAVFVTVTAVSAAFYELRRRYIA